MKKLLLMTLTTVAMVAAAVSAQDADGQKNTYLGGGVSTPLNALGDTHKLGFNGMVRLAVPANSRFDVLFGLDYHTFKLDSTDAVDGGSFSDVLFFADLKINVLPESSSSIKPFLFFGAGLSNTYATGIVDASNTGATVSNLDRESRTLVAGEFGGGFETDLFFVLAKAVNSFDSGSDFNFVSGVIGVRF